MPTVSVPGLGDVDFPEGTPKEVMETAIRKKLGQGDPYESPPSSPTQQIATAQLAQTAKELAAGANRDVVGMTLPEALATPSRLLMEPAQSIQNPYLRGAAKFGAAIPTAANALMLGGGTALGEVGNRLAAGVFGTKYGIDTLRSIPELWRLYKTGDYDKLKEKATDMGLGSLVAGLGLRYAVKGGAAPETATPKDVGALEAAKAAEKVASAVPDEMPETKAAAQANVELQKEAAIPSPDDLVPDPFGGPPIPRWAAERNEALRQNKEIPYFQRPHFEKPDPYGGLPIPDTEAQYSYPVVEEMRPAEVEPPQATPEGAPPTVERAEQKPVPTAQGPVVPNERASEPVRENLEDALDRAGVDVSDPQHIAEFLAETYGLKKPVKVEFTDEKVSSSYESPDGYLYKIPKDWQTDMLAHETQHARAAEGQIAQVPEGPGANDQIAQAATDDLGGDKYVANINMLRKAGLPDDAKTAIAEVADGLKRRGPIPWEQTAADARVLGYNEKDVQALAGLTDDLRTHVTAARNVEDAVAIRSVEATKAALADPSNPELAKAADVALKQLVETMQAGSDIRFNVAGATSSFNIQSEPNLVAKGVGDLLREIQKRGPLSDEIRGMLRQTDLSNSLNRQKLRQRLKLIDQAGEQDAASKAKSVGSAIRRYYLSNILSGIPTAMIKLSSDITMTAASPAFETVGALVKHPTQIREAFAQGEARAKAMGSKVALMDALAAFTEAWKNGSHVFGRPPEIPTTTAGKVVKAITPPSLNFLGAINDSFHLLNERGELYARGIVDASKNDLPPEKWLEHAKEFADNPTDEELAAATAEARKTTLTAPPTGLTKAFLELRGKSTGVFVQAPVVTVPSNLFKMGVFEMTPPGAAKVVWDVLHGKEVSNQTAGRAVLGAMAWTAALYWALDGHIHDSGQVDGKKRNDQIKAGWRPDVLVAGNHQIPLRLFGPWGMSVMTAADIAGIWRDAPRAPGLQQATEAAFIKLGRTILDYPMLQGLSNMIEFWKNPRFAEIMAGQIASGFVPWSSMLARGAAAIDDDQRKLNGFVDAIKARIPFWRETVPAKFDYLGRPLKAYGSKVGRFVAPVSVSEADSGPTEQIAASLGIGANPTTIQLDKSLPALKLEENDAAEMEQLIGQNTRPAFEALDKNPGALAALPDEAKRQVVSKIISGARAIAKGQMLGKMQEDGRLANYIGQARVTAANKAQLDPYAVDMALPGNAEAEKLLRRYGIPEADAPSIPPELWRNYLQELKVARSQLFHPYYANLHEIGEKPWDQARVIIAAVDEKARAIAAFQTLDRFKQLQTSQKAAVGAQ